MTNDDVLSAPRRGGTAAGGGSPSPRRAGVLALILLVVASTVAVAGAGPAAAAPAVGTVTSFSLPADLGGPAALSPAPDGAVWFVPQDRNAIGRVAPDRTVTAFSHPGVVDVWDIAVGSDGNLWFVALGAAGPDEHGLIGKVSPTGSFTLFPNEEVRWATTIDAGPDGRLWFTTEGSPVAPGGALGAITTSGEATVLPADDEFFPVQVVFASDGTPWVVGLEGRIGRADPALSTFVDLSGTSALWGWSMAAGADGAMWFAGARQRGPASELVRARAGAEPGQVDRIGLVQPGRVVAAPNGGVWTTNGQGAVVRVEADGSETTHWVPSSWLGTIQAAPDGSVWFFHSMTAIGRLSASGQLQTFPTNVSERSESVVGPNGDLWFVQDHTRIGRITTTSGSVPVHVEAAPGKQQATVSWSPPLVPAEPVTGYEVVASPGGQGCTTTGATSCVVPALVAGTTYSFTVRAIGANGAGPISASSNSVLPWSGAGFRSLPPTRILDSRLPNVGFSGRVASSRARTLRVTGLGGPGNVPATATAVVMNVTVTDSTQPSFLTVYPTGTARPNASNLNFGTNQVIPNLVTTRIGTGGSIDIATAVGSTHVVADVVGYYDDGAGDGDRIVAVSPVRLLDSRVPDPWGHPLRDSQPEELTVRSSTAGSAVPWTATGVVVNVTVTNGEHQSFLTVYPEGSGQPDVSNLNFLPRQTIANLAFVRLEPGADSIRLANAIGSVDVIVDLVGYVDPTAGSRFHAIDPNRVLDTRTGNGLSGAQGPGRTRVLAVAGRAGTNVPVGATAVIANLTVADATAESYVSVFPGALPRPERFSNLNFGVNQVIPNLTFVGVAPEGTVNLYNHLGQTHLIADVVGWYAPW